MNSPFVRSNRFMVSNPDAHLSRRAAVRLIHRHADQVRVFEDLEGYPALMVADKKSRRLVLFAELSDEQIYAELPEAWRREHYQSDLFRDAPLRVANDACHPPISGHWWRRFLCG